MQRTVRGFTDGRASPERVAKENGFEVGMYIRRKSDKCLEKIEAFVGDKVHISIEEGPLNAGKASLSVAVLLSGKWRVTELKGKPEKVNFMSPVLSSELQAHVIKAQIDAVLTDIGADAVKTGMLSSSAIIECVADALEHWEVPASESWHSRFL